MADGTFLGFTQLTHSITVRLKSLKERALINELILKEFSETSSLKRGEGISCKLNDGTEGYAVPICLYDFRRPYCGCEGRYEMSQFHYFRKVYFVFKNFKNLIDFNRFYNLDCSILFQIS